MQGLCASQGRDMLALIAPGESFSEEEARWWTGHNLALTSNANRATVERIRDSSRAKLTATQVAALSGGHLSTRQVEAADLGIEGRRVGLHEGRGHAPSGGDLRGQGRGAGRPLRVCSAE